MVTQSIQKQIDIFVKRAKKHMDVEQIILYGSSLHPDSLPADIDILVKGTFPTNDPEGFLYDLYTDIPRTIDFHIYGIASGVKNTSFFLKQALHEGKVIYSRKDGDASIPPNNSLASTY